MIKSHRFSGSSAQSQTDISDATLRSRSSAFDSSDALRLRFRKLLPLMEGTFFIGDSVANNLRRSKLDGGYNGPYLVMSIGDTRFKTGNDFRSGTDPAWEHTFTFPYSHHHNMAAAPNVTFEVKNKARKNRKLLWRSSVIGVAKIGLSHLCSQGEIVTLQLFSPRRRKPVGLLKLMVRFEPHKRTSQILPDQVLVKEQKVKDAPSIIRSSGIDVSENLEVKEDDYDKIFVAGQAPYEHSNVGVHLALW